MSIWVTQKILSPIPKDHVEEVRIMSSRALYADGRTSLVKDSQIQSCPTVCNAREDIISFFHSRWRVGCPDENYALNTMGFTVVKYSHLCIQLAISSRMRRHGGAVWRHDDVDSSNARANLSCIEIACDLGKNCKSIGTVHIIVPPQCHGQFQCSCKSFLHTNH